MAKDSILDRLDSRLRGEKPQGERPSREEALERIKKRYGKPSTTDSPIPPIPVPQHVVVRRREGEEPIRRPVFDPDVEGDCLVRQVLEGNRAKICEICGDGSSLSDRQGRLPASPLSEARVNRAAVFLPLLLAEILPEGVYNNAVEGAVENAVRGTVDQIVTVDRFFDSLQEPSDASTLPKTEVVWSEEVLVPPYDDLRGLLKGLRDKWFAACYGSYFPDYDKQIREAELAMASAQELNKRSADSLARLKNVGEGVLPKKPEEKMVEIKLWQDDGRNPGMVASAGSSSETPPIAWKKVDVARSPDPVRITRPQINIGEVTRDRRKKVSRGTFFSRRIEKRRIQREERLAQMEERLVRSDSVAAPLSIRRPKWYVETEGGLVPEGHLPRSRHRGIVRPERYIETEDGPVPVYKAGWGEGPVALDEVRRTRREEPEEPLARSRSGVVRARETPAPKVGLLQKIRAIISWPFRGKWRKWITATGFATAGVAGLSFGAWGYSLAPGIVEASKKKLAVEIVSGDESVGYVYGEMVQAGEGLKGIDRSVPINPKELEKGGELYHAYWGLVMLEDQQHDGGVTDWIGIHPNIFPTTMKQGVRFVTRKLSGGKWTVPKKDPGGTSTISDQACGQMQEKLPFLLDPERSYDLVAEGKMLRDGKKVDSGKPHDKLMAKAVDTACGIGLSLRYTPEEIGALYMTFSFLAGNAQGVEPFVRSYWGFEKGVYDSRITIGHQLLLASLIRHTWVNERSKLGRDGKQMERWERKTVPRAKLAADRLLARDMITLDTLLEEGISVPKSVRDLSEKEQVEWLRGVIYEQIETAIPKQYGAVAASPRGYELYPKEGYDYLIWRGIRESRMAFGDGFREVVQTIELTSDGYVQGRLVRAFSRELSAIGHPEARGTGLLVDHRGNIIAAFSGRLNEKGSVSYDEIDRVFSVESELGSLGKLILAAGVAHKGYRISDIENPWVRAFRFHLKHSERKVVDDAKILGVAPGYVGNLINLFGREHGVQKGEDISGGIVRDYLDDAAMGSFSTTPSRIVGLMTAARTGEALPPLRVVRSFTMRDGRVCEYGQLGDLLCKDGESQTNISPVTNLYEGFSDHSVLVSWMFDHQKSGKFTSLWEWYSVPLDGAEDSDRRPGTLHVLDGVVDAGKTGTVGKRTARDAGEAGTTKGAWVIVGTNPENDEEGRLIVPALSGVFGIAADAYQDNSGNDISFGNNVQGGTNPAYVARDVIQEARNRFRSR